MFLVPLFILGCSTCWEFCEARGALLLLLQGAHVGFNGLDLGLSLFKSIAVRDSSLLEIKEDTDLDPEENSAVFMGILIKGLAKLKKIPETVKAIQDRLEQELKQIVKRSTTQVADNGYQRGENISQENQPR